MNEVFFIDGITSSVMVHNDLVWKKIHDNLLLQITFGLEENAVFYTTYCTTQMISHQQLTEKSKN